MHRRRRLRRRHHRQGDRRDRRLPADRAGRDARRRQALRGRDGRPQARGVLLDMTVDTLRFATAGSVDDGKSTLVGRLLHDSKSVLTDQLEAVEHASRNRGQDAPDLALLTDGLRAEREQGITIDV
ncbi:GTP-binding protein, partial [Streptomyces sp. HGB0020]|uniref:GTP-binding protein n=1 Tax=Streptomyces sp. HGB0020 TaxID=1078086 RepID=UPI003B63F417